MVEHYSGLCQSSCSNVWYWQTGTGLKTSPNTKMCRLHSGKYVNTPRVEQEGCNVSIRRCYPFLALTYHIYPFDSSQWCRWPWPDPLGHSWGVAVLDRTRDGRWPPVCLPHTYTLHSLLSMLHWPEYTVFIILTQSQAFPLSFYVKKKIDWHCTVNKWFTFTHFLFGNRQISVWRKI